MEKLKKKYSAQFKAKVALEALKEEKTSGELSSLYQVHSGQIRNWKITAKDGLVDIFSNNRNKKEQNKDELIQELYRQIGQLKVELDWLKKIWTSLIKRSYRSLTEIVWGYRLAVRQSC